VRVAANPANALKVDLGGASHLTGESSANGAVRFSPVTNTNVTLSATRSIPTDAASAALVGVNLQDAIAIAICKMIVGLEADAAIRPNFFPRD
jgi:hypothetical protein